MPDLEVVDSPAGMVSNKHLSNKISRAKRNQTSPYAFHSYVRTYALLKLMHFINSGLSDVESINISDRVLSVYNYQRENGREKEN